MHRRRMIRWRFGIAQQTRFSGRFAFQVHAAGAANEMTAVLRQFAVRMKCDLR